MKVDVKLSRREFQEINLELHSARRNMEWVRNFIMNKLPDEITKKFYGPIVDEKELEVRLIVV